MAEVNTGDGGHGKDKKVKQKKQNLRVDFTPMVDMNMLLITFFMFCTSLVKPQTMEINMPSRDKVQEGEESVVKDSEAITILLGGEDRVFYYFGMLNEESYLNPKFLVESDYSENGIRAMLLNRNRRVVGELQELKEKRLNDQITEEEFKKQTIEIKGQKGAPVVMIKALDEATYKNLIDVLDEMQIANVGKYAIIDVQDGDIFLVQKALGLISEEDIQGN